MLQMQLKLLSPTCIIPTLVRYYGIMSSYVTNQHLLVKHRTTAGLRNLSPSIYPLWMLHRCEQKQPMLRSFRTMYEHYVQFSLPQSVHCLLSEKLQELQTNHHIIQLGQPVVLYCWLYAGCECFRVHSTHWSMPKSQGGKNEVAYFIT